MKRSLLRLLACPDCGADLALDATREERGEVRTGTLACEGCGAAFPVRDFVPRFVPGDEYARAFTIEWRMAEREHLDSHLGLQRLDAQFRGFLDFPVERLEGKLVLDAGCGLGRFAEVALNHGAEVVGMDLSYAIDVAFSNLNWRFASAHFIQADVFRPPLKRDAFDLAYSTGVLHHTPDPPRAFASLPPLLRPGGKVMVMVYARYNRANVAMVQFWRRLASKLSPRALLAVSHVAIPLYYVSRIPLLGPLITRILIPVSVRAPTHRARVGNTFDTYAPKYNFYYDHVEVFEWFHRAGLEAIRPVGPDSGVCFIGTRPGGEAGLWEAEASGGTVLPSAG